MAVTLTLEQLADHLRIERAAIGAGEPTRTILVELMQVATERVEQYAPNAPRDTQNLAVARFAGYVYDAPTSSAGATYGPAFLNSGAVSLLNPWKAARAEMAHPIPTPSAPTDETDLEPTTPVVPVATRYFALGATEVFTESDFLNGEELDEDGRITVPVFPAGLFRAFFGLALEHGKTLHQAVFGPEEALPQVTPFIEHDDITIAGEPYRYWATNFAFFTVTAGEIMAFTIEDV